MKRADQINEILVDLEGLKRSGKHPNIYAIEENIIFFKSILSFTTYLKWLLRRAPKIEGSRLLELADLPFERWDLLLHKDLIAVERKKIPGMLTPLVKAIITSVSYNGPTLIMDFGSGGMETERQVVEQLLIERFQQKIIFVGVDRSTAAHNIAKKNLSSLKDHIDFYFIKNLDYKELEKIGQASKRNFIVVTCQNDIFSLESVMPQNSVDVVFHTRFRHHLNAQEAANLDVVTSKIAKKSIEFDEYKSYFLAIIQSFFAWRSPVLLNGAILSRLREQPKKLLKRDKDITFQPSIGTYMKIAQYVR